MVFDTDLWRLEARYFQKRIPSLGMHFLLWFIEAQIWQFCHPPSIRLCLPVSMSGRCRWRQKSDSCKFSFLSGLFSHLLHGFFSKNSIVCQFIALWKAMLKEGVREVLSSCWHYLYSCLIFLPYCMAKQELSTSLP